jgi:hypothetical protein
MSTSLTFPTSEPNRFRQTVRIATLKRAVRHQPVITAQDVREFLMAYCACFLAVSTFIA